MLHEELTTALRAALRGRDALRVSVLRMLSAAIHNREIERRATPGDASLSHEDIIQVIRAELKKRQEAAEHFTRGGRPELARREDEEAAILRAFLPPELSDAELEAIIAEGTAALGISSAKEFGKLMGWVMGRVGGRAAGERVGALIRSKLAAA